MAFNGIDRLINGPIVIGINQLIDGINRLFSGVNRQKGRDIWNLQNVRVKAKANMIRLGSNLKMAVFLFARWIK